MSKKKDEPRGIRSVEMTTTNPYSRSYSKHRVIIEDSTSNADALEKAKRSLGPAAVIVKVTITFVGIALLALYVGSQQPMLLLCAIFAGIVIFIR